MKKTALLYVTDLKGYQLTLHSLASFMLTQSPTNDIYIYCHNFYPGDADLRKVQAAQRGFSLHFEEIAHEEINNLRTKKHITPATYLKFICLIKHVNRYDKLLYADNDLLFFKPLGFENFNFNGMKLAAVLDVADASGSSDPTFAASCKEHGVSNKYFNAGLMLFNCAAINQDETMLDRYLALLRAHQEFCWYKKNCQNNDQCVVNRLFNGQWTPLPLHYNMQACLKYTGYWSKPYVRHYQGHRKFIPVAIWRDDLRGIKMVRQAQQLLEIQTTPIHYFGLILYWLNGFRQIKSYWKWRRVIKMLQNSYGEHFIKTRQ